MRKSLTVVAGLCLLTLALGVASTANAQVVGLYYNEVEKDGRVYVFNTPETFNAWSAGGEIGKSVTLIGRADGGKTLVGENETAVDLYLFKHNLPAYDRATPKPVVPPKYPATKFGGRFYGDFTSKENKNKGTGAKSTDSGVGIDVKRFYFTVTHEFDAMFSAQFQTDIGDQGARRYDVFVKKAYVQAKFSDAAILRAGSADLPWVPYAEGVYGMRYFEQTIIDSLSFGTSADWGLHLLGSFSNGKVAYQVSAINGKGYSNPTRTESVDLEGRISVKPFDGFSIAVGGYTGKLGNETKVTAAKHTAERVNGLVAYSNAVFGFGVEYFQAKNWKNVTTDATDKADGVSIFASFVPVKDWKIFARYDQADPSKDINENLNLNLYNLGVERRYNKSLAVNLAYKFAEVKGGTVGTGNGTIGSAVAGKKGTYSEVGLWAIYEF
ncbi:MAG: hypothetical protein ABI639_01175 [Thermoanaerobaculia bacterium]